MSHLNLYHGAYLSPISVLKGDLDSMTKAAQMLGDPKPPRRGKPLKSRHR